MSKPARPIERHVVAEQAAHGGLVSVARRGEVLGERAVGEGALVSVDVAEERVERPQPLREAGLEVGPLLGGDEPGDRVDGEADLAEVEARPPRRARATAASASARSVTGEGFEHRAVQRPRLAGRDEGLIEHPLLDRIVRGSARQSASLASLPSKSH